jgi:hypothetical protein
MNEQPYLSLGRPLGSWVWNVSYYVVNPKEMFDFCKKNHVTELYLSINRDVTDLAYVDLIRQCASYGIRAAALSGDPSWILPSRQSGYHDYLERVDRINELCGDGPKFYSLHLDVEPHVLPEAKRDGMQGFVKYFVDFIKAAREHADQRSLLLEWDIPAWFGRFTDEESDCPLTETIFRYCDAVGIMAYSDSALGQYNVVMPNVEVAKKMGKPIMIGSETMDLDEARREDGNCAISYYEEGKIYMYKCLYQINTMVEETYDQFGFAIHDMKRWIALQPHVLPKYAEVYAK